MCLVRRGWTGNEWTSALLGCAVRHRGSCRSICAVRRLRVASVLLGLYFEAHRTLVPSLPLLLTSSYPSACVPKVGGLSCCGRALFITFFRLKSSTGGGIRPGVIAWFPAAIGSAKLRRPRSGDWESYAFVLVSHGMLLIPRDCPTSIVLGGSVDTPFYVVQSLAPPCLCPRAPGESPRLGSTPVRPP